jgi:hypothetical protein
MTVTAVAPKIELMPSQPMQRSSSGGPDDDALAVRKAASGIWAIQSPAHLAKQADQTEPTRLPTMMAARPVADLQEVSSGEGADGERCRTRFG